MKHWLVALLLLVASVVASCKGGDAAAEAKPMESNQKPVIIASDFETREGAGPTLVLYGVKQKVSDVNLETLPAGTVLVYCTDEAFIQHVGSHFSDMANPKAYVGVTMFASIADGGAPIELFRVKAGHQSEKVFSGKIAVAYLEVGEKGNPIRVKPKL